MTTRTFDWRRFSQNPNATDAWALASESSLVLELYAAIASEGTGTFHQLREDIQIGDIAGWDATWIARLARIISVQPFHRELGPLALQAFQLAWPRLPRDRTTLKLRRTYFELLYLEGDRVQASELLDDDLELDSIYYGYLRTDTMNPYVTVRGPAKEAWLERFNYPFTEAGLSPVEVDDTKVSPFDGLHTSLRPSSAAGPLVSVILTTYNPAPSEIQTAVRSILNQTWANLEVLIVDDHSEAQSIPAIDDLAAEDSRIRVIRMPKNGGTYRARNFGIREAQGKYITGQDTDDWSHPERIEREVKALEEDDSIPGVTTSANRTDSLLVRASLGNNPHRSCEVSLMLRTETARRIGGYLPVRKAGDSEFRARLEQWWGGRVRHLDEPLYIIRLSHGSLSRADFRPGWSHHARRAFWSSYTDWHENAEHAELEIDASDSTLPCAEMAPSKIAGTEWARPRTFDVCVVADWRGSSQQQRAAFDELTAMVNMGIRVAILHLDTPWGGAENWRALSPGVQRLVTTGKVWRVLVDDEIDAQLLLVRDPAALDFGRQVRASVAVKQAMMLAHSDPSARPETFTEYDPKNAHLMASHVFSIEPKWVVPDGQSASNFENVFNLPTIRNPYPYVVEAPFRSPRRLGNTGLRTVIGRTASNSESDWPDAEAIRTVYPTDGSFEIRVLGDARGAVRALGEKHVPAEWVDFRLGSVDSRQFWRTVDAFILYDQGGQDRAYDRDIYEALAAGAIVVTDALKAENFGHTVVVAKETEALGVVMQLMSDPASLEEYRAKARNFALSRSGKRQYIEFIKKSLSNHNLGADISD